MTINLIDARRGLHNKCLELFSDKKIAEQIYRYLCDGIEDCEDAEPTKHGRWLIGVGENGEPIGTYCSECGWSWERNIVAIQLNKVFSCIKTPRCPHCGAKMKGADG